MQGAGRSEDAAEHLKEAAKIDALAANAGRSRVLLGSAKDHLHKGETGVALDELRQAADLSPEYPEVQFQLARALKKNGAPPREVVSALQRSIALKPDYAEANFELGLALEMLGENANGLGEIRRSVELAPSLVEAHRVLGEAALKAHDWSGAISEFGAVLAWNETDQAARQKLAIAQSHLRNN